jgi:hypothetical protein
LRNYFELRRDYGLQPNYNILPSDADRVEFLSRIPNNARNCTFHHDAIKRLSCHFEANTETFCVVWIAKTRRSLKELSGESEIHWNPFLEMKTSPMRGSLNP